MKTVFSSQPFYGPAGPLVNGSIQITLPDGIYEILNGGGQVGGGTVLINLDATGKAPNTIMFATDELAGSPVFEVQLFQQANALGAVGSAQWSISGASPIDLSLETPSPTPGVSQPMPAGQTTIPFSATPVFPASTFAGFVITLTGNVTSSSISGGVAGTHYTFVIIQDGVGNHTFAWPANVINAQAPDPGPNQRSQQTFYFDGTNFVADGGLISTP